MGQAGANGQGEPLQGPDMLAKESSVRRYCLKYVENLVYSTVSKSSRQWSLQLYEFDDRFD